MFENRLFKPTAHSDCSQLFTRVTVKSLSKTVTEHTLLSFREDPFSATRVEKKALKGYLSSSRSFIDYEIAGSSETSLRRSDVIWPRKCFTAVDYLLAYVRNGWYGPSARE